MSKHIKKTSPVVKMTLKKIRSFSTTGIIPYLLILVILAGLFSPAAKVNAQTTELGQCTVTVAGGTVTFQGQTTQADCNSKGNINGSNAIWV